MPTFQHDDPRWIDFYIDNGFAMVRGLVDRSYCDEALARVRRLVDNDLPLNEWSSDNTPVLHHPYFEGGTATDPVFDRLLEQPKLVAAIDRMFRRGDRCDAQTPAAERWDRKKNYYLFLKPHNPKGRAVLAPTGHIDFPTQPLPALYRGFTFQVLLAGNEPFSGNLTLHPGTHALVQKAIVHEPGVQFKSGLTEAIKQPPPVEFVGEAGDVCFMHHLVFHSGNDSFGANRLPRIAIHAEAFREAWLKRVDPADPHLSPWERSIAHNGVVEPTHETEAYNTAKRREYVDTLREKPPAIKKPAPQPAKA